MSDSDDLTMEIRLIRNRIKGEVSQERELAILRSRIETTRNIVEGSPRPGEDPIVHCMIVDELKEQLPRLERRVNWLTAHRSTRRS